MILLTWNNRLPDISLAKMVFFPESAENCNLGSATVVSHLQVPHGKQSRMFHREEKDRRAVANQESMAVHWLRLYQARREVSSQA